MPITAELNIEMEPQHRIGRAHVLRISNLEKSVLLQASSEDDQLEWAAVLQQVALIAKGTQLPPMRATEIPIQAFRTTQSATANGHHPPTKGLSPLEMLAQESGANKKHEPERPNNTVVTLSSRYVTTIVKKTHGLRCCRPFMYGLR